METDKPPTSEVEMVVAPVAAAPVEPEKENEEKDEKKSKEEKEDGEIAADDDRLVMFGTTNILRWLGEEGSFAYFAFQYTKADFQLSYMKIYKHI